MAIQILRMKSILTILIFVQAISVFAQNSFVRTYGDDGYNYGRGVISLPDSGFIICGNRGVDAGYSSVWVMKLNSDGEIKKEKYLGAQYNTSVNDMQRLSDSTFLVTGMQYRNFDYQCYLALVDTALNVKWEKTYGSFDTWDYGNQSTGDTLGNIWVVGKSIAGQNCSAGFMLKLNIAGDSLCSVVFNYDTGNETFSVDMTPDSNLIITCVSWNEAGDTAISRVIKTDMIGNILWTFPIVPSDTAYYIVRQAKSYYGNLVVFAGGFHRFSDGFESSYFGNVSQSGSFNWEYTLGANYPNYTNRLQIDSRNYFYALGTANFYGYNEMIMWVDRSGSYDYFPYGDLDVYPDYAYAFDFAADSSLVLIGSTQAFNTTMHSNMKILLIKTDTAFAFDRNNYAHFTAINNEKYILPAWIYPNPASDRFMVQLPDFGAYQYEIWAADGKSLSAGHLMGSSQIETGNLPRGIYFIRIFDEEKSTIIRLIIQR